MFVELHKLENFYFFLVVLLGLLKFNSLTLHLFILDFWVFPLLLTDEKVRTLLSTPEEWYVIGTSDKWISGVVKNIESMKQKNISHLINKGKFEIKQRKNEDGQVDIYCRYVPFKPF